MHHASWVLCKVVESSAWIFRRAHLPVSLSLTNLKDRSDGRFAKQRCKAAHDEWNKPMCLASCFIGPISSCHVTTLAGSAGITRDTNSFKHVRTLYPVQFSNLVISKSGQVSPFLLFRCNSLIESSNYFLPHLSLHCDLQTIVYDDSVHNQYNLPDLHLFGKWQSLA